MSLRWLYLAVLGPLVLLATLAWWGTRVQIKAAWTDARDNAELLAPQLAQSLTAEIASSFRLIPIYPHPPSPGPTSPQEEHLQSDDLDVLNALRDDEDAGTSASGLPLRALAALRIEALFPNTQDRQSLIQLLTESAPSALTAPALTQLGTTTEVQSNWRRDEEIRRQTQPLPANIWSILPPAIHTLPSEATPPVGLARRTENHIEFFSSEQVREWLQTLQPPLSPGLQVAVLAAGNLSNPSPDGRSLATAKLGREIPLLLEVRALPERLEASLRRQQRWTLALLAGAMATAGIALFTIHRTVARERRLAELKSQFVSSVSHELRAPLGSIRLMAEALQQGKVAHPSEFHTLIAREGARLSHLIENVLDFARIEDGRKRYRMEETDLTALIHAAIDLLRPQAKERQVTFESRLPELVVSVDPAAWQQAMINLLDNALKFSPEGGIVRVSAHQIPAPPSLSIAITDQGPGIPKDDHAIIFERFHRLGNELRRETQGAGIGLSIVKHIVEAHGGAIHIDSQPGHGCTFTLILPLTAHRGSPTPSPCAS
ncbi:signal transduction histidine kinase [Haloferula luteola]|uniref:histidine kinase n=1 Tax=Haloferula luteola TaxID=595692 RepID=A0A840UW92_9BACT|nr:HAMP domain-containing sensor histidine kinase [Haloferula luteola]MBB5349995.1 signal transduction histidine kinase [Haloferula luteola]